ncbi:MAG: hypothetical protein H6624_02655 [Bdellovibrionaceae bacterium]|nr:hypothetical protein [Bdellovibrionales bacterium]MCB9083212.1 hypothetical protein [Pseudobdellovibrionaceae bacterium]
MGQLLLVLFTALLLSQPCEGQIFFSDTAWTKDVQVGPTTYRVVHIQPIVNPDGQWLPSTRRLIEQARNFVLEEYFKAHLVAERDSGIIELINDEFSKKNVLSVMVYENQNDGRPWRLAGLLRGYMADKGSDGRLALEEMVPPQSLEKIGRSLSEMGPHIPAMELGNYAMNTGQPALVQSLVTKGMVDLMAKLFGNDMDVFVQTSKGVREVAYRRYFNLSTIHEFQDPRFEDRVSVIMYNRLEKIRAKTVQLHRRLAEKMGISFEEIEPPDRSATMEIQGGLKQIKGCRQLVAQ